LSAPVERNLHKLISKIEGILNNEDNVTVHLYILGIPEAECLTMGDGTKEIHIVIDEDGIHSTTFWVKIKRLVANFFLNIIERLCSLLGDQMIQLCLSSVQRYFTPHVANRQILGVIQAVQA
jgi:hypothetical protein